MIKLDLKAVVMLLISVLFSSLLNNLSILFFSYFLYTLGTLSSPIYSLYFSVGL